ncbi:MAG: heme NO-binding domain-containing protein [Hyphomicrobium sp.]|jgi:hypothetical protein
MKGVVFTELFDFVAATFGDDMVDDIIADSDLPNGGAYTSVGTYDHREMQALVTALAVRTQTDASSLLTGFGKKLCERFAHGYPAFFQGHGGLFDFLESVQRHIHVEVRKLYPDAELPSFATHSRNTSLLELDYRSCRPLAALAEGLILGAAQHFGERVDVAQSRLADNEGNFVRFAIQHVAQ